MTYTRFQTTDAISPYHVAIVLSEFERSYNAVVGKIDTNWWYRQEVTQEIKFAQTIAKDATLCLKEIFTGIKFPYKLDHIIIPSFRDEGVESWGISFYK